MEESNVREVAPKQVVKLLPGQLLRMEWVRGSVGRRVVVAIGRADDQDTPGPQCPPNLGENFIVLREAFQSVEANDNVSGGVRNGYGARAAVHDRHVFQLAGRRPRMSRIAGKIQSGDGRGYLREQGQAAAFA